MAGLHELKAQYPDRHIRQVRDYFAATRLGRPLTTDEIAVGLAETLIADSVEDLAGQLAEQAAKSASRRPAE